MSKSTKNELIFQFVLHIILFLIFSFDKDNPHIHLFQIVFFLNYAIAAWVINYSILPKFYYPKKYLFFVASIIVIIALVILIEEAVLEQIFFPDSRGKSFPGVIFSLLEVLPPILLITGSKFAWDAHQKHKELTQLKQSVKDSELRFLKSQIHPHFLFNHLNNLYAHAIEHSPKTPSIILELSAVLRYTLYDCKEDFVSLHKEIEHLKNYTKLNELQVENRGNIEFQVESIPQHYKIAPLILSVFIENAFKHSTSSQDKDIDIRIDISFPKNNALRFTCINSHRLRGNIEGLPSGIGLKNVQKRLDLLYPNKHQLDIHHQSNTFEVVLDLELTEKEES